MSESRAWPTFGRRQQFDVGIIWPTSSSLSFFVVQCMWVEDIDVVDEEHSMERLDEEYDLLMLL